MMKTLPLSKHLIVLLILQHGRVGSHLSKTIRQCVPALPKEVRPNIQVNGEVKNR